MNFYVMTLFPQMVMSGLNSSIMGRAIDNGLIHIEAVNIRNYAFNKHNKVDDYIYGGGAGMLMQAEPVYLCYKAIVAKILGIDETLLEINACEMTEGEMNSAKQRIEAVDLSNLDCNIPLVYLTPQGRTFKQEIAKEYANEQNVIFLCGD